MLPVGSRTQIGRSLALVSCAALAQSASGAEVGISAGANLLQLPQVWRDDRARDVSLADLRGHRVVMTMAYATCHRICPASISDLERMQRGADAHGEVLEIVVVGYDPKNDGPATWHRYRLARRLNRDDWHFLTGSPAATAQLARQLGFPFWRMDEHVMHESRAVLFDSRGIQQAALGEPSSGWPDAL